MREMDGGKWKEGVGSRLEEAYQRGMGGEMREKWEGWEVADGRWPREMTKMLLDCLLAMFLMFDDLLDCYCWLVALMMVKMVQRWAAEVVGGTSERWRLLGKRWAAAAQLKQKKRNEVREGEKGVAFIS